MSASNPSNNMGLRLGGDLVAGASIGMLVAPMISAVDRALAENASGKAALFPSFISTMKSIFTSPVQFVKSPAFCWIWLVYGSTYTAANMTTTICSANNTSDSLPKLASTTLINTTTCIAKDRAFAKLFGTKAAASVPMMSYGAWLGRDVISMACFFTLPPLLGPMVGEKMGSSEKAGINTVQVILPLAVQTIATPVHLLGYDIYNNPNNTIQQRIAFLGKDYWKTVSIRCLRQAPPWSVGTIGNREVRSFFHTMAE